MILFILFIILFWIFCGVLHYGVYLAYSQRKYPELAEEYYFDDVKKSIFWGLFGPFALVTLLLFIDRWYGFKWR